MAKDNMSIEATNRGTDRRAFLRGGAVAGAAAATVLTLGGAGDAFGQTGSTPKQQFAAIRDHEQKHVPFVIQAIQSLGGTARPKPTFQKITSDNFTLASFVAASQAFENTGTGAYLGALPYIYTPSLIPAAASIALIEARHSGFLNSLRSQISTTDVNGVVQVFEQPLTIAKIQSNAMPFIASLNGGPAFTFSTTPSVQNDIAILNFALVLEYLEMEFYNDNVRAFYGV